MILLENCLAAIFMENNKKKKRKTERKKSKKLEKTFEDI
jgi:hypothetical protein